MCQSTISGSWMNILRLLTLLPHLLFFPNRWYVSNVSIIFDCSMLLYYPSWMFYMHYYAILYHPINLVPSASCCFFLPISVFRRNGISNGVQTEWNLRDRDFPIERAPGDWTLLQEAQEALTRVEGAPWARPLPRGPLGGPPTYSFLLHIPTYPRQIRYGAKNLIPPPQPSVPVRSHLGAFSGAPPEGASTMEGFYIITIAPPMKCE